MKFKEAFRLMEQGVKVKLPSWSGYWYWDADKESIIMHTKDGEELDIRETQRVELELAGKITSVTFSKGGIDTIVPAVDGVPIVSTPSNRMYTAITVYDGKSSDQKAGGYTKGTTGKDINFLVMPRTTPLAISKQDKMRIFDPNTYQKADAWSMDYRRFHDLWILDNKLDSIFMSIKDAQ